ncbi:hypothetical protein B0H12DRAFT_1240600 [Mycena haematopus]|nr:hypothetical protein B0H12DRAFT_1240600 [Mycena haematopus]
MSSSFSPTAAALHENPDILLRNRDPFVKLTIRDSKLAAVIEQGSYFITSPNADTILAPPTGATRSLHLRQDGLWGDDDHIQWPQLFTPSYCYFSAIPTRPPPDSQGNTDNLMLWFRPTREHFICPASGNSILRGCGKLSPSICTQLRDAFKLVQVQFDSFSSSSEVPPLLPPLIQTAALAISRLESLPSSYMEMLLAVRAFQRSLLEGIAMIQYKQIYQPRILGQQIASVAVDARMGTFTSDLRTVEDHVSAGLRVWFIQPSSAFHFQNILAIAPLIVPEHAIEMALVQAGASPSFVGDSLGKVTYIHHLTRKISHTPDPDPFNNFLPTESMAGPIRNQNSSRRTTQSAPYSKAAKAHNPAPSSGRDKYKPVDSPYMPDYIPEWRNALASVNTHRPSHPRSLDDGKYMFPDIAIFCTANSDDRKARYFTIWNLLRDALIYRVFGTAGRHLPVPFRTQDWRDILNGDMFKLNSEPQVPAKRGLTKNHAKILSLEKILAPCLAHAGVSLDPNNQPIHMMLPSTVQARACLWEISELNFRLEFIALDKRLHVAESHGSEAREGLVHSCFPGGTNGGFSLFICDLEQANKGLADRDWKQRGLFLGRLNKVMESWEGYGTLRSSSLVDDDEEGVSVLGFRLARFYTQSFFENFGRAPSIPMALYAP